VVVRDGGPLLAGRRLEEQTGRVVGHVFERLRDGGGDGDDALAAVLRRGRLAAVRAVRAADGDVIAADVGAE
jgi:hypothetical protein